MRTYGTLICGRSFANASRKRGVVIMSAFARFVVAMKMQSPALIWAPERNEHPPYAPSHACSQMYLNPSPEMKGKTGLLCFAA